MKHVIKEFFEKRNLNNHFLVHISEMPDTCEVFNKTFLQVGILKYHLETHVGETLHICEVQST